jgi:hypothetical protein
MNFKLVLFFLILFSAQKGFAQSNTNTKEAPDIFRIFSSTSANQGKINILQDDQIKSLVNRYTESRRKEGKIPGYRIRIFSDSGQPARQKAMSERNRFVELYPETPTYLVFEAPNFKVYVGDFRSKTDGFMAYKQIAKKFRNAFLIPTKINLPKI